MEVFQAIGAGASILSLFVSAFVAVKVIRLGNSVEIRGDRNAAAGRDVKIER